MKDNMFRFLIMALATLLIPDFADAQVHGSGPSDSSDFDLVIDIPPEPNIGFSEARGGDGLTTQINVGDGGNVGGRFDANSGVEVNISGGNVDSDFDAFFGSEVNISGGNVGLSFVAFFGSEVNISGGNVGSFFDAFQGSEVNISGGNVGFGFDAITGSEVNISGGNVGGRFRANSGSDVELFGGEFKLNGVAFTESTITLGDGDVFTGTLTDGSAFIFSTQDADNLENLDNVTLSPTSLPVIEATPIVINTAFPDRPSGLRAGQTLTLQHGGELGNNFESVDGTLNIEGGSLGFGAGVIGSQVNISGGNVAEFNAFFGSEVNISGGNVGSFFDAFSGSEVNISGGSVGSFFGARAGSEVNISGGSVGSFFGARAGSEVNISGGNVGSNFRASAGSDVELFGGEFKLNGVAFTESTITLGDGDVFTGTLTDGSAFIFSTQDADNLDNVTLSPTSLPVIEATPIVINTAFPDRPSGLRAGQTLTLQHGGELGNNFESVDGTLNIEGGSLGAGAGVLGSQVNISGGNVANLFCAYAGSEVNISGGNVGNLFCALPGSEVNISGGNVGSNFRASAGSQVNISSGNVGVGFGALPGSEVNISGGNVGVGFGALPGSEVNVFGTEFLLDGMLLDNLVLGEAFIVSDRNVILYDRNVILSGLLADGTTFNFELDATVNPAFLTTDRSGFFTDFFSDEATLTVTLVPESQVLLGDCSQDGAVNFSDISPFISILSAGDYLAEADTNEDGVVSFSDIRSFIAILSGN